MEGYIIHHSINNGQFLRTKHGTQSKIIMHDKMKYFLQAIYTASPLRNRKVTSKCLKAFQEQTNYFFSGIRQSIRKPLNQ